MAAKHKNLVVHLKDGGTEGIPVKSTYRVPDLTGLEWLIIEAVDKSQVQIPTRDISKLHLKAA